MQKYIIIFFTVIVLQSHASDGQQFFQKTNCDLGVISSQKDSCIVYFNYENMTNKTINIERIHTSCGCTSVEYSMKPIKTKEAGRVKVAIATKGIIGFFERSVVVLVYGLP